jgi:radical SAM/Cys-rich protein
MGAKMNKFEKFVSGYLEDGLNARDVEIIQANLGLICDQHCRPCYLNCGPDRTEIMNWPVMEEVLDAVDSLRPRLVDITGGAPELNPYLRDFITALRNRGHRIQLRTNLTALAEPAVEGLAVFLRESKVKLVASLPCYLMENMNHQRGDGAYRKSIRALKLLNDAGYSVEPGLQLDLVYNPGGAAVPGKQSVLEEAYRRELFEQYNINFSRLLTITNMPIGRYLAMMRARGKDSEYARLLKQSFHPGIFQQLICRNQITIRWDGIIFDCDFNLALGLKTGSFNDGGAEANTDMHIADTELENLRGRRIITGEHCFGCTAVSWSDCIDA